MFTTRSRILVRKCSTLDLQANSFQLLNPDNPRLAFHYSRLSIFWKTQP